MRFSSWCPTCSICSAVRLNILPPRNGLCRPNVMKHMPVYRSFLAALLCAVVVPAVTPAQQVPPAAASENPPAAQPRFNVSVQEVVTPVTVTDKDGNLVNALQPY